MIASAHMSQHTVRKWERGGNGNQKNSGQTDLDAEQNHRLGILQTFHVKIKLKMVKFPLCVYFLSPREQHQIAAIPHMVGGFR